MRALVAACAAGCFAAQMVPSVRVLSHTAAPSAPTTCGADDQFEMLEGGHRKTGGGRAMDGKLEGG